MAPVEVGSIDTATSIATGTADAGANVEALIVPMGSSDTLTVPTTADSTGAWSADVSGTWTLQPGDHVAARQVDGDGDGTLTPSQPAPSITTTDSASGHVEAGGTIATTADDDNRSTSAANPIYTRLRSPAAGEVTIEESEVATTSTASWYQLFDLEVAISAPPAPEGEHITIEFRFDGSAIPQDVDPLTFRMFRNGTYLPRCYQDQYDPCLATTPAWDTTRDQWIVFVETSRASTWNVGVEVPLATDRLAGDNRVETAAALSRDTFDGATTVVLARADTYPDALAGAPLAAKLEAPILLSSRHGLSTAAATEIQRLGATRAVLLGGEAALSAQVEQDLAALGVRDTVRHAGTDRFDTARRIAREVGGSTVYVTEGANADPRRGWPDAVAVSALAAFEQHPILLVTRDRLPAATSLAIQELGVSHATIVGGSGAVSDTVARVISGRGVVVDRVSGSDRYHTSARLAERAETAGMDTTRPWLATGLNYPDALVAGPAVAHDGGVLLLVNGATLDRSTAARDWLAADAARRSRVVIVGGDKVVSQTVVDQVEAQVATARASAP